MSQDLPAPLTPPDCDLRGLDFMPLKIEQLRRSKAWSIARRNPEVGFYMVNLWSAAYLEVPAGSLEDDDELLADLAMCDPCNWSAVRTKALHGFVKCSDGRLYHPTVCRLAIDAMKRRLEHRRQQSEDAERKRIARAAKKDMSSTGHPPDVQATSEGHPSDVRSRPGSVRSRTGTGTEKRIEEAPPPTPAPTASAGRPPDAAIAIIQKFIELKRNRWPDDPNLPANGQSERFKAERALTAAGGRLEIVIAAIEAAMARYPADRQPPRSLAGIERSLDDEIAKLLATVPAAAAESPRREDRLPMTDGRTMSLVDLELKAFELAGMDRLRVLKARGQLNLAERAMRGAYQAGERDAKALVEAGRKAIETATQGTSHARSERADAGSPAHA